MPLSNYDARWLEVLRDAGTKEKLISFDRYEDAVALRHMLYRIRGDMQREKHEWYDRAAKVKMSITFTLPDGSFKSFVSKKATPIPEGTKQFHLRLVPDKFSEILDKEGYKIPEQPDL